MNAIESRLTRILAYTALSVLLFITLFPIALLVLNAFKSSPEIIESPLALPDVWRWDNFSKAWAQTRFSTTMLNSALLAGLTIILVCTTGSLTAYVLARRKVKSWKIVTFYLLATTTAPIQLFLFPLYFGFARLGMINNVFAVSLVYTALWSPFAVMLLRTYFLAVPKELEESALVDGATHWQVFTRVMLPIVSPGILTVALIVGLNAWNEFLIANTFLPGGNSATAIVAFFQLSGQYSSDWGVIMAAAALIVLPVVILFVLLQRRFIEGMAGGSVKG
ncbi:carbohydrate ABC transporter permease [Ketogulonicigenium vulgare]|uniref:Sugar ABC transporter, permease protein, ThuG n=1 Tax=Ketogulonicigenium vulgare (strain WSH-001) TaxID=759362 RepID=F9Y7V1_KETVW|nr:carbohydrate ABC transporter permease [Ketogulonicigenium vulgare]ADO41678.1 sugar ABC transporter, permease protein, ThuG [Ketogulonicigenium vulgare Y25]AEM39917.1 Sugar ABC transporter, permease protein, ThuG [Ketogulonicigenium vulgare WSH-001]ALJ80133.1 sugar ABC transporter permease [Ketogulonicigenium vulgare]ANW33001.1 sugar ABC transporter permease [Ketogulonicigenium vulgare]AOZ53610.1 sugar ABC transporter permease, ThuG [Ketogulonicigenium vulgare]